MFLFCADFMMNSTAMRVAFFTTERREKIFNIKINRLVSLNLRDEIYDIISKHFSI